MTYFKHKTIFISGASRGIGLSIAQKLAADGANIIIAAKSIHPNPKLEGTIFTAARAIEEAGGKALPVQCDIRFQDQVQKAVRKGVEVFGGLDILINNASAINLNPVEKMEEKRYDLMQDINAKGTYFVSQACIPYLKNGDNPHILNLSPPLNMNGPWLGQYSAYTMSKFNMTMIALGLAEELKPYGIAANTLWPQTTIATAAVKNLLGGEAMVLRSRKPEILADAAYFLLKRPAKSCTGHSFIDESILAEEGITDLASYAVTPGGDLQKDLFL